MPVMKRLLVLLNGGRPGRGADRLRKGRRLRQRRSTDKRSVCYRLEADEKKGVLQNSLFCSTLFVCN